MNLNDMHATVERISSHWRWTPMAFFLRAVAATAIAVVATAAVYFTVTLLESLRRTPECVAFDRYRYSMDGAQHQAALQACMDSITQESDP